MNTAPRSSRREVYFQQLNPGTAEAYRAAHRNVWPELEQLYRDAGYTDISCFIHDDRVLVYVEYDPERLAACEPWLRTHEVERRWQTAMKAFKDTSFAPAVFEEIYRLGNGTP